jgi:RHS repeat-associated protein
VNRSLPALAQERDGSNALQRQYVYGQGRIRQTQGTASYYLYDGLGSVVTTASSTGAVQRTWSYEPYGSIRTSSGSSPANFWQFAGEYLDPTGLYHLGARQYDPVSGRFLSRDPLPQPRSEPATSSYAYVGGRATLLVDPSGRSPAALGVGSEVTSDVVRNIALAGVFGGATGCVLGAVSAIELGPLGMAGVCIVSGVAGAQILATAEALEEFERYFGPLPG